MKLEEYRKKLEGVLEWASNRRLNRSGDIARGTGTALTQIETPDQLKADNDWHLITDEIQKTYSQQEENDYRERYDEFCQELSFVWL